MGSLALSGSLAGGGRRETNVMNDDLSSATSDHIFSTDYGSNANSSMKIKHAKTGNEEVNFLTYEWFKATVTHHVINSGPMLKAQTMKFTEELENVDIKANNGWLESFKKRHNLAFGIACGKSGDVKQDVVSDWKQKLPELIQDYQPSEIYNMDETRLLFKDSSISKALCVKDKQCSSGKH
ncbi:unnamed protein product [Caretta caretta]